MTSRYYRSGKLPEREIRAKLSHGTLTPPLPRKMESCCAQGQEKNVLDEARYFGKKDPLDPEDEEDKVSQE